MPASRLRRKQFMNITDFDFSLPDELIALRPVVQRDRARLLVIHPDGLLEHAHFGDLPAYLRSGDLLVVNDSRVDPVRLAGRRLARDSAVTEVEVELTLHRRLGPGRFVALAKPARRLKSGDRLVLARSVTAVVVAREAGDVTLEFDAVGSELDRLLEDQGDMPLPPYIATRRAPDRQDKADYQTVYADRSGSIAAPTAGLHFTSGLLHRMQSAGIERASLTLHVGLGTFLPVTETDITGHRMHGEMVEITPETASRINAKRAAGGRIVAVGTTVLRSLESAVDSTGEVHAMSRETDIFITPGHRFRTAQALVTNFHLPRSTLFMLVSAFMGVEIMQAAYAEAIREKYRFYSYGDACLLLRDGI